LAGSGDGERRRRRRAETAKPATMVAGFNSTSVKDGDESAEGRG
jgi:hypothetical protein